MSSKDNGGAAFPMQFADGRLQEGLTLRDYFAARAMQGLISAAGYRGQVNYVEAVLADSAYLMADAMLAAR